MKRLCATLFLAGSVMGMNATAQVANDKATQDAILAALPAGVTPETATADEVAQAAVYVAFAVNDQMESDLTQAEMEESLTQVMVSLGELTRAGFFESAPRFGTRNPPGRFYTKVLNVASSNLDTASTTYYGTTVQYIIGLTAAMREGQNFLNNAEGNPLTAR